MKTSKPLFYAVAACLRAPRLGVDPQL